MSGKFGLTMAASLLSLLLVACGGDSGSSPLAGSGNNNGGSGDDNGGQVTAGAINLFSASPQIGTAPNSEVTLTATFQDNNGVLLPNIPIAFSTSDAALQVLNSSTDANGSAQAILSNPSDPRNRSISVSATSGGLTDSISIQASGTSISVSGPTAVSIGSQESYTVRLTDSDGNGISGEEVTVTSSGANTLAVGSQTTSGTGTVNFDFTAQNGGTDTITVSAFSGASRVEASLDVMVDQDSFLFTTPAQATDVPLNVNQTLTVALDSGSGPVVGETISFSATRGNLSSNTDSTDGSGNASVVISSSTAGPSVITATTSGGLSTTRQIEFVANNPSSIVLQANDTQLQPQQETEVTAVLRDSANNLVKGQLVTFRIDADVSNGSLLQSQATTDSLGRATVTYRAGSSGTGENGVTVEASTASGTQPTDTIALTVGGQALRITLGTGNEIIESDDDTIYERRWVAIVTDVTGAPVANTNVELKLLPTSYGKGTYIQVDVDGDGEPDQWAPNRVATCPSEDIDGDGLNDPGEDFNGDSDLDPSNEATFAPVGLSTNSEGLANFSIRYPQSSCSWVDYRLTATVRVQGSESKRDANFTLSCSAPDLNNLDSTPPGGITGLYGTSNNCANPN